MMKDNKKLLVFTNL